MPWQQFTESVLKEFPDYFFVIESDEMSEDPLFVREEVDSTDE